MARRRPARRSRWGIRSVLLQILRPPAHKGREKYLANLPSLAAARCQRSSKVVFHPSTFVVNLSQETAINAHPKNTGATRSTRILVVPSAKLAAIKPNAKAAEAIR